MSSCHIGWIVSTFTDFSTAEQFLEDPSPQGLWEGTIYRIGRIGQSQVVLVCAAMNESVYNTARLMVEKLRWEHIELSLCFVSTFGYSPSFYCQPALGDCVLSLHNFDSGFYQISGRNVTETSLNNAAFLLRAAKNVVDHQTGYPTSDSTTGYIRLEYNPEEADIARHLCCSQGFDLIPCLSVTGICGHGMGDDDVNWVPFATQAAAVTISSIITRLGQ
ncbi:uncharacterized protein TrAFT101_000421 [Trichoderma asperellum]|uniref:uncharacterized protein n=1 Tax=Trichoderma asperellum TaxID=101201 RepID=UPI003320E9BE|nr:hypothetical protein TrAFT101_000421 [Trichoderma asperellum]